MTDEYTEEGEIKKAGNAEDNIAIVKQAEPYENNGKPVFGCAKGMFVMMPDFDEPLEDFEEYM